MNSLYLRFTVVTTSFSLFRSCSTQGGTVKAKGIIYLSNIRMVFVAKKPVGNLYAFDMPMVCINYLFPAFSKIALRTTNLSTHPSTVGWDFTCQYLHRPKIIIFLLLCTPSVTQICACVFGWHGFQGELVI